MSIQKRLIFLVAIVMALSASSCDKVASGTAECVKEKWEKYRPVVEWHANGQLPTDEQQLEEAADFLDQVGDLAGIPIRWDIVGTLDILLITEDTKKDLEGLDSWYARHWEQLRCENGTDRIVLSRSKD